MNRRGIYSFIVITCLLLIPFYIQAQNIEPYYGCSGSGNVAVAIIDGRGATTSVSAVACAATSCAFQGGTDRATASAYFAGIPPVGGCYPSPTSPCEPGAINGHCQFYWTFADGTGGGASAAIGTYHTGSAAIETKPIGMMAESLILSFHQKYLNHELIGVS